MRRLIFLFPLLLMSPGGDSRQPRPVMAGIETSLFYTPDQLIKEVFIKGNCQNVSNITTKGNSKSVGFFEGGNNIFGFESGIIISSGDIELAEGPNTSIQTGATYNDNTSDPDIDLFVTSPAYDVAGIEFDFVPVGETVTFRYVFASEEYCEFVGSIFNDVFGFFVSGPGINGPYANNAINVATLPGSNEFVAINSVNHSTNSGYYIRNEIHEDAAQCNLIYVQSFQDFIEYDGMTKPLTATIEVIPCETYHIRLLVADVGDAQLDSGVFLESQSFDLTGDVTIEAIVAGSDEPLAVEGCRDGVFIFTRTNQNLGQPLVVHFTIHPGSSAQSGVDFTALPDSVIIPAGQNSVGLPIIITDDQENEPQETLTLQIQTPCDCLAPLSATLFINDQSDLEVEDTEITVCTGQSFTIGPTITGGIGPFNYLWQDGSTSDHLTTVVDQNTHFFVTVTDACGTSREADIVATTRALPGAVISGEVLLCDGETGAVEITFEGSPPWAFLYSIDGVAQPTISGIDQNPYQLPVTLPGIYLLTRFNDAFCTGIHNGSATVALSDLHLITETIPPSCFNTEDGSIALSPLGGQPPYRIQWFPPVNDEYHPTALQPGQYEVMITDATGCSTSESINLMPAAQANDCKRFKMYVPNAFSPNGDGVNDEFRFFPAENSNISEVINLQIFNRWGGLVLQKNNFPPLADDPLWDGRFKGKPMGTGVFVWQAVLLLEDGTEQTTSGEVIIIR